MYETIQNIFNNFLAFTSESPGMALIILVSFLYYGEKIARHFNNNKYKDYSLIDTLNHPREAFGLILMGVLFIVGVVVFLFRLVK